MAHWKLWDNVTDVLKPIKKKKLFENFLNCFELNLFFFFLENKKHLHYFKLLRRYLNISIVTFKNIYTGIWDIMNGANIVEVLVFVRYTTSNVITKIKRVISYLFYIISLKIQKHSYFQTIPK